jgi:nucleoside 2-deoxyribosyltransferase
MRRRDIILLLGASALIGGIAESAPTLAETPMGIYLAGPFGFSEAGRDFTDRVLVPELIRLGFQVIDPFKLTDQAKIAAVLALPTAEARRDAWQKLNMEIGRNNQLAIDGCNAVLAVLDGADVDSGTASEIGYAFARNKPILGYRSDFRLSSDNEGSIVNLQVEYFIRAGGGEIVTSVSRLADALLRLPKSKL